MCGKLGNCIEDSIEGDDSGVVEEKLSTPGVPISFFFLFFLCIMLTQHINGKGFLVFDIFVNVFAETYIMARYLCKVVLESINASTTFRFEKITKGLRVSKNLVTISPSKVLLPRHCCCFGLVFKLWILFRFGVVPSI